MTNNTRKNLRGKLARWKGRELRIQNTHKHCSGRIVIQASWLDSGVTCMPFLDELEL